MHGGFGVMIRFKNIKIAEILFIDFNKFFSKLFYRYPLFIGALNGFVVDISPVSDKSHFEALINKKPSEHVKYNGRPAVPEVTVVIYGRAAKIDTNFSVSLRRQILFLFCQSIIYFHSLP